MQIEKENYIQHIFQWFDTIKIYLLLLFLFPLAPCLHLPHIKDAAV